MTTPSDRLAALANPEGGSDPWGVYVVASASGGTVNLDLGDGSTIDEIPCLDGYHTRAPGDVVLVGRLPIGWVVFGRLSAPPLLGTTLTITTTAAAAAAAALPEGEDYA